MPSLITRGMLVYRYPAINSTWDERNWLKQYPEYEEVFKGNEITTTVYAPYEKKNRLVSFTPGVLYRLGCDSRETGRGRGAAHSYLHGQKCSSVSIRFVCCILYRPGPLPENR